MIKPVIAPEFESAAGFQANLEINSVGTGAIVRNGQEIDQTIRRPHTADLVVGARLLHTLDYRFYEIVSVDLLTLPKLFTIKRLTDETTHAATLRQLKQHTLICEEQPSSKRTD